MFDMDLVGLTTAATATWLFDRPLAKSSTSRTCSACTAPAKCRWSGRSDYGQEPPVDSPFENIVGSQFDDLIEIDPLPSVIREVDGNDGWEPLAFDGGGSEVIDTGRLIPDSAPASYRGSLTATGIGSIKYNNIEWVEPFNAPPRMIDNDDPGYGPSGNWGRTAVEGYLGDERLRVGRQRRQRGHLDLLGRHARLVPRGGHLDRRGQPDCRRPVRGLRRGRRRHAVARHRPGRERRSPRSIRSTSGWPPTISAPTGAAWEELTDGTPLYFFVTGHELQVQLSNLSAATNRRFAMADAVRIERINGADLTADLGLTAPLPAVDMAREPEIRILAGATGTAARN